MKGLSAPFVLAAALALGACAGTSAPGNPLAGRIWSTADGDFVDAATVEAAVEGVDLVLLGETHDIAAHHRLQARLVRAAATQRRPAVVFEMIHRDQQPAIEQWRRQGADPAAFGAAVEWERRGWPDWSMYRPIIETAAARELPVYGGAPPRQTLRQVGHGGLDALGRERLRALGLDRDLPQPGRERLVDTLRGVHCGIDSGGMVEAMFAVQRLRDAYLAESLRMAVREHGAAVLIAGRGHTRSDHGVPTYLPDYLANARLVTTGFAGTGEFADLDMLRHAQGGALAHDYIWFTDGGEPAPGCAERGD